MTPNSTKTWREGGKGHQIQTKLKIKGEKILIHKTPTLWWIQNWTHYQNKYKNAHFYNFKMCDQNTSQCVITKVYLGYKKLQE